MNAKFEKWWKDEKHGQYFAGHMRRYAARKGWNGAIQSLEVTPELVTKAARGICKLEASTCNTDAEDEWTWYGDTYTDYARAALTAVLSALKEQAK